MRASGPDLADPRPTLLRGGRVLTGDPGAPDAGAVLFAGGVVVALGDEAVERAPDTAGIVDLAGRCLVPGFRDGHVHPLWGGIERTEVPLAGAGSVDEVLDRVAAWAADHPDAAWVTGGSYDLSVVPGGVARAEWLDRVVPDRPVALVSDDHHTLWCNSVALAAAGITAATPDPPRGRILRHGDGTPTGTLVEWDALDLVLRHVPARSLDQRLVGLDLGLSELARAGVVWAQDAACTLDDVAVYAEAARRGRLPVRVNLALWADPAGWAAQRVPFVDARTRLDHDPACAGRITARTVKFFADGVLEMGTAALLEPYADAPHTCGLPNWSAGELAEAVAAFTADGFQVHVHAIGDAGVRMALDAVEHATTVTGRRPERPVVAHCQVVDPVDLPRFAALGVVANVQPLWFRLDDVMERLTLPRLGPERSALQYPAASLAASGARLAFGSDWPVSSVRPLDGLAVAVTRTDRHGRPAGGWLPGERLALDAALAAYTAGTAYQAFEDGAAGRLVPGERADAVLLAEDVTTLDGREVADVAVQATWLAGDQVWGT